ncbi:MAG: methylenetetrahydrofolate reductase, partial [Gemmiger sp.]|nr:methylenetetrahydrofolate reductase [Gemmiger sp.]
MQISQMFKRKPCVFSIECFPPKQTANFDKMKDTLRTMRTLNPDFISVTYGAGGSTGGVSTVEVAEFLKNDLNVEPLAHMICMGSDKAKAAQLLDQLNAAGVRN